VLREKDIMQPGEAVTPARRIYLPIMMMYLDCRWLGRLLQRIRHAMTEFMGAVENQKRARVCIEISRRRDERRLLQSL